MCIDWADYYDPITGQEYKAKETKSEYAARVLQPAPHLPEGWIAVAPGIKASIGGGAQ